MKAGTKLFYDISIQLNKLEDELRCFKTKEERKSTQYYILKGKVDTLRNVYNKLYVYGVIQT